MSRLPELRAAARLETIPIGDARIAPGTARRHPDDGYPAWRPFLAGEPWARPDTTYVMDVPVHVPAAWTRGQVFLNVSLSDYMHASGPEGLAYLNGVPLHGIDRFHSAVLLSGRIQPGQQGRILIEAYSSLKDTPNVLRALDLELVDPDVDALYHDFRVLTAAVDVMPADSLPRARIMRDIERAYRALDLRDMRSDAFRRSAGEARGLLRKAWEGIPDAWQARTIAVGHAHIDLAWLWPVAQTRRKGARTFSTVLRLMERYPGYRFVQSQPALYEMVREDEPDIYAEVKARVGEGRWEPTGASWVEMDCNLPGGESLVRQFLLGKRFFRDELGVDPRVLWLPDVFGYSAALPQVLKGCEVDYFMTTKISWNEYNRFPYDTFLWRGIDGSEVLSYMPTTPENPRQEESARVSTIYTYNALLTPYDVQGAWREYRQKAINDELLYLFGFGDGGGGPTADMLETAARLETLPGIIHLLQGSAEEFFAGLDERVRHDPDLPTWAGELYFEYHRGTYTSQAWIKRANRKSELLYREAELWTCLADMLGAELKATSHDALTDGWKLLLFNQFHDILPGSSIGPVYEDARADFKRIGTIGDRVREEGLRALTPNADGNTLTVFNPAPFEREDPVEIDLPDGVQPESLVGSQCTFQRLAGSGNRILATLSAPSLGFRVYRPSGNSSSGAGQSSQLTVTETTLENQFFRIELDEAGEIASLLDRRTGREVIAATERGNSLVAFEDKPLHWDAWDIQIDYQDKPYPIRDLERLAVVENGPLRGGVEIARRYRTSTIRQRMLIYRDVPRIDFETEIDWQEHQTLLKAAFPVNVASPNATFEIQWGNLQRPTHWNTSWEWARFETCAHKWIDLSEGDFGVSLLNDCKYGHDVHDHVMRITLIKSPISPDPNADQGLHRFTYSLLPHVGDWRLGDTVRHAYLLNMPAFARLGAAVRDAASFASTDRPGLVIETVKQAEDGDGIIVRCYDAHDSRGPAAISFGRPIRSTEEVNMLERQMGTAEFDGDRLFVDVRPFGIHSFRVRF